jgi:glycosyltransferase involved in cell wall biosynthesis/LmbE family N-acetylglucosaminyl deacetylase
MIGVDRVLVLAPHPDDEIIGCGAVLKRWSDSGIPIKVVVITDGVAGLPLGTDPAVRKAESRAGLAQLGIRDCEFWDFPDGHLPFGGVIADRYVSLVESYLPSHLLLPHPAESHPDHRSLTRGILRAVETRWSGSLWFYETTHPCQPVNRYEDATKTLDHKLEALASHGSQLESFDYVKHCRLLAQMRGLMAGNEAAEAFLAFNWDGSPQQFFTSEPLVSIVVRTSNAALVKHALASLTQQTYPWIEIVLVWFGEGAAPKTADLGMPVIVVQGTRNRGANLNAGAGAARGDFIGFLDEDDILYLGHISALVAELVATPDVDIAFSGCRVMSYRQEGDGVALVGEVETIDHDYEPGRLLVGNYLTLHSALLRRNVVRAISFDPDLEAYEDWDFFAHAEQRGFRFARVDGLGCEYRLYPEPGEEATVAAIHLGKGYIKWREIVRDRICRRFRPSDLDRLERFAHRHETPLKEAKEKRDEQAKELARAQSELMEYQDAANWVRTAMRLDSSLPAAVDASVRHLIGRDLAGPTISIAVPVYDTEPRLLAAMLQSIVDQSYPRWQLCLVDDASTSIETRQVLDNFARIRAGDSRVIVRRRPENGGIVAATNDAVAEATGELVAFVDHDDVLAEDALLHVAMGALREPGAKLIYTDSRMIDHVGNVLNVFSKPDWSPTTLLAYNYINHLTVIRRDLLGCIGGLRQDYAGAQDWDLLLRLRDELRDEDVVHLPLNLYDWRATNTSLAYSTSSKPWAAAAAQSALADALARHVEGPVKVEVSPYGLGYLVDWKGPERAVTVVIPTHSNREGLRLCLRGLLEETDYPALRLLVIGNRCEDAEMRADLDAVAARSDVRVVDDPGTFNWSALMNRAMAMVETEAVLFLNDDVEILEPDWLRRMQRFLDLPGTGAVGAMLFYPDGGLQHGGIETHPEWIAADVKRSLAPSEMAGVRDVSAVTGACLLTTRSAIARVGGLDEAFPTHYNDVDFCLALRVAGYRVIQAADVRLKHHESVTRGRVARADDAAWNEAIARMRRKWGRLLKERYRITFQMAATTRILSAKS